MKAIEVILASWNKLSQNTRICRTVEKKLEKETRWQDKLWRDSKIVFKTSAKSKKNLRKAFKLMEGMCFVISIAGLSWPNTGKSNNNVWFLWINMISFSSIAHHAWCSWLEFCVSCLSIHDHQGCISATCIWIWICHPSYYHHQHQHQVCTPHNWSEQWESMGQQDYIYFVHWIGHGWVIWKSYKTI